MTDEQRRRATEALAETQRLLAKEMRYSPHLRKPEQIARYEQHIAKLTGYLKKQPVPRLAHVEAVIGQRQ